MSPSIVLRSLGRAVAAILVVQAGLAPTDAAAGEPGDATQAQAGSSRTGKERLGGKGSDEQRVDNCKVPPDRRGAKPRPDECADDLGAGSKR